MLRATLGFPWRLGVDRKFPPFNFTDLVRSLDPQRIDLLFIARHDARSELRLRLVSGPGVAAALAEQQLKAVLIRLEGDYDFECSFDTAGPACAAADTFRFVRVDHEHLALPSGKGLSFPLPLLEAAVEQLQQADVLDVDLAYRVSLQPRAPDAALARTLVPPLAELHERAPQGRTCAVLHEAFEVLQSNGWHAVEAVGLASQAFDSRNKWAESSILGHIQRSLPFVPGELWDLRWSDEAVVECALGVATARPQAYLGQVFEALLPPTETRPRTRPKASGHTQPLVEGGPFVFVSYAHTDKGFMEQVVDTLLAQRVRCWVDKAIEPGAIWDETLEERIRQSQLFLVCHSAAYEASRYCRRELKFADMLSKSIVPVALRPATWGSGLSLMFQELQILALDHDGAWDELRLRVQERLGRH